MTSKRDLCVLSTAEERVEITSAIMNAAILDLSLTDFDIVTKNCVSASQDVMVIVTTV